MTTRLLRSVVSAALACAVLAPAAHAQTREGRSYDVVVFGSWGGHDTSDVLKVAHEGTADPRDMVLGPARIAAAGVELVAHDGTRWRLMGSRTFGGNLSRQMTTLNCPSCAPRTDRDEVAPATAWTIATDVGFGVFTSWPVHPHIGLGLGYRHVDYDQAMLPEEYATELESDDGEWFRHTVVGLTAPVSSRLRLWAELHSMRSGIIGRLGNSRELGDQNNGRYLVGASVVLK